MRACPGFAIASMNACKCSSSYAFIEGVEGRTAKHRDTHRRRREGEGGREMRRETQGLTCTAKRSDRQEGGKDKFSAWLRRIRQQC